MKTFTPIKFTAGSFEIVPFEARACVCDTAVQMPPALTDILPRGTFRES
jgi:hypothetical protein